MVDRDTTPTSAFYVNADGTGTATFSAVPVRFKAADGTWRTIDRTLVADSDGTLRPRSTERTPRISVGLGVPTLTLPTTAGDLQLRHTGLPVDVAHPLGSVTAALPGSAARLALARGAQARLAAANGAEVDYTVLPNGVRDDIVLQSPSAGSTFTVTVSLPAGVHAQQRGTAIDFVDSAGAGLATYSAGTAYDATAAAVADGNATPAGTVTPVSVRLLGSGSGTAVIGVSVDSAWLADPSRAFPVVIDPTTSYWGTTGYDDTYVSSDNPTSTIVSSGPYTNTPYENLGFLRLGDGAGVGTARIMLRLDNFTSFTPQPGYQFMPDDTATLSMFSYQGAACVQPAGAEVIETDWDPSTVTWSSSQGLAVTTTPPDGWQTPAPKNSYTNFNVSTAIAGFYNHLPFYGLEIRQQVESMNVMDCWKNFYSEDAGPDEPSLTVTYDYVPPQSAPSGSGADNGTVWSQSTLDDPVDVVTGNLKEPVTDLASPAGVYGLDWTRTFNSYDAENGISPGGIGSGWSTSFYPTVQTVTGGVQLKAPDGRLITWAASGTSFTRPFEYPADLTVVNGNYRVSFDDGSYWDFDSVGRLARMTSPNGQTVSINRNAAGQLTSAVSSTGAQLAFTYGTSGTGNGKVISVSGPSGSVGYAYDTSGNLNAVTNVGGKTTSYGYDASKRLTTITDPTGIVQITNTFDSKGRVATQHHASGGTTSFSYDKQDTTTGYWMTVVTDTVSGAGGQVTYYWDAQYHEVRQVKDNLPNTSGGTGNTMLQDFSDALGDLTAITSRLGGRDTLTYDNANRVTCDAQPGATCPAAGAALSAGTGAYTAYSYDTQGRVTAKYIAGSGITTYSYTGNDRLPTGATDANGHVTNYTISGGLVMSQTDADGVKTTYTYDTSGRVLTKTIGGNTTSYAYDTAGRPTCVAQPGGSCPNTSGTGGSGDYTTTTYYPSGLVHVQRAADGGLTTYTYDDAGRILTVTDPTGAVTTNHYDPSTGLLTSVDKPSKIVNGVLTFVTTHYTYDANGNQTCVAPPGGTCPKTDGTGGVEPYQLTVYGPLGRVTATTNELAQTTSYKYDADGNKIETDNPDGSVVKAAYDAAGRLYCTTVPGASAAVVNCPDLTGSGGLGRYTITAYDTYGRVSCAAQPGGSCAAGTGPITTYTYDSLGRQHTVTDVNGGTTTTTYTNGGRVYQVSDPDGGVTTTAYDSAGRKYQVIDPNHGITTTLYTPQGWVSSTTDADGLVTSYTYDPAGRQATVTAPDGVITTRTYTLRGELKSQQTGTDGTVSYTYNGDGSVASVTDALGNTTSYDYDARGNRTARVDADGRTQQWGYDNANELVTRADQLNRSTTTTEYNDATNGHKTVVSDPSGRTFTSAYNPDGTIASATANNTSGTITYNYSYDNLGHPSAISDGTNSWGYSYNATGALTSATNPSGATMSWSYDPAGRRTTMTYADGTMTSYGYDAGGRLTSVNLTPSGSSSNLLAAAYTYDSDGNLKTVTLPDGSRTYSYGSTGSSKGKLTGYTQTLPGTSLNASIGYDANGRVQSVTTAGTSSTTAAVAAGNGYSLALKPDGTVWAWGGDAYGQLGDDGGPSADVPVQVGGIDHVTAIAAGYSHAVALKSDGTVWSWGDDSSGELGNGTTGGSWSVPVKVKSLTGIKAIAAGFNFSIALKSDGTVWAWGRNADSELGNNSTTNKSTPVQVSGLSGITAIGAGDFNGLAIGTGGAVWAWGYNGEGSLGNGTTTDSKVPVQVVGLTSATAVGGGYRYSVALKSDGTVWAWGHNSEGELGNGTTTNSSSPVEVSGLGNVTAIGPGYGHQIAVKSDGTVWAWGTNTYGELGNGSTTPSSTPTQVSGLTSPTAVASGGYHNIALLTDGSSAGWGANTNGELGTGSVTATSATPTAALLHAGANVVTYTYDNAGQLIQETNSDGIATTYTYDHLGRRKTQTAGGQVTTYAYDDASELCWTYTAADASTNTCATPPTGATTYNYDAAGRLLAQTTDASHKVVNTYDQIGRIQTSQLVVGSNNTTQTRSYDPAGNLTATTDAGSDSYAFTYSWDLASATPTLSTAVENGTTLYDGIYGAGQWAAYFGGAAPVGVGIDATGNVIPTTPTLGIASAIEYDAWGNTIGDPTLGTTPTVGYRGELRIGDQVDLRARTYLPTLGAFATVDPLDGLNGTTTIADPYPYADNSPVEMRDPTGKAATDWDVFAAQWHAAQAAASERAANRVEDDPASPWERFKDPVALSFETSTPLFYIDIGVDTTIYIDMGVQGNVMYFSTDERHFGMSYTDERGSSVSVQQTGLSATSLNSTVTVNEDGGVKYSVRAGDFSLTIGAADDVSVELDEASSTPLYIHGQNLLFEQNASITFTAKPGVRFSPKDVGIVSAVVGAVAGIGVGILKLLNTCADGGCPA